MKRQSVYIFAGILSTLSYPASAGWGDLFNQASEIVSEQTQTGSALSQLSQGEISGGLKEALILGSKKAIGLLSQEGGFLNDSAVRIPLPEKLALVEKTLRNVGQADLADEFINTMNHAAEQAVPQAVDIFQ